jgi:hypothetical protein
MGNEGRGGLGHRHAFRISGARLREYPDWLAGAQKKGVAPGRRHAHVPAA